MSAVEFRSATSPAASPTPRRVSAPRWLDLRLVLGLVLVLAAVLTGATVIARARHTDRQLAVTRDLAAGTRLRASDLRLVATQLPDDVKAQAGYLTDPARAIGKVLAQPLHAGELVPAAVLSPGAAHTTVSMPFAADTAPALSRGERIVVWLSTASCPSVVLLPDVTVQDVRTGDSGGFSSSGNAQDVVVSVAPELARRVVEALAIDNATIRAGVLTGAATGRARTRLPALSGCAPSPTP
jgi:hypothetical protein